MGRKPDIMEYIERVRHVRFLLGSGMDEREIRVACVKQWDVHWQTVNNYIRRAKKVNLQALDKTIEELRSDAVAVYSRCIQDTNADWKDRLKAQELKVRLLGLEQREPPVNQEMPAAIVERMFSSIPVSTNGNGSPPDDS